VSSVPENPRLSDATLNRVSPLTGLPGFDRSKLAHGIVHLGLGAFARAHLATYVDDMLALEPGAWGIIGASLRSPEQRDRLAPQNGLYTALEQRDEDTAARIIGCVKDCLVAPEDPERLIAVMADPATRIVSLSITEKGYCHDPATGRLDEKHPDIRHDLEHPTTPRTSLGLMVEALDRRREAGLAPFTVLCCDNLPHNGDFVGALASDFASLRDHGLAAWIDTHVAFPCTMVDRIVPATTAEDIETAAEMTHLCDLAPVVHEPFRQFVVQDRFVDGVRPPLDIVGVELVEDVAPYETMKLRMLNGAHSALAYLGYLAGKETIADAVADPAFAAYLNGLWAEVIEVVPPPPGVDLNNYAARLMDRFANRAIRHRTWQIAMDGSQKLPQRLLATIRERIARDMPFDHLALAVAAWVRYVGGTDERGQSIDVRDPMLDAIRETMAKAGDDPIARVRAVIRKKSIFGMDLMRDDRFIAAVTQAYSVLLARGAQAAVAAVG
jgi:fructuronate reductase